MYLRTYAATGSRAKALLAAGQTPAACAARRRKISRAALAQSFPAAFAPAAEEADLELAVAALESEAVRRALSGVSVPVFHQGRECGSTVKHSDQLLMFLLKTLKPERYAGGREGAPSRERPFCLELDLSAAGEAPGQEEADQEAADGCGPEEGQ